MDDNNLWGHCVVLYREDIVIWVQKKTGAPIITVNTVDEAQRFLKKYHTFVVGLFEKFEGPEHEEFVKAAKSDDEIQFVETSNKDVAKLLFPDFKTNNVFIGLVKTEAERYTVYDGSYKMEKILEFLGKSKFPLITKLTESNTVWVYSSPVKLQVTHHRRGGLGLLQPVACWCKALPLVKSLVSLQTKRAREDYDDESSTDDEDDNMTVAAERIRTRKKYYSDAEKTIGDASESLGKKKISGGG